MKNKVKAWLFEAPAILLLIISFIVSIYLAATKQFNVNWATPPILGIIIVLFFIGKYYDNKKDIF